MKCDACPVWDKPNFLPALVSEYCSIVISASTTAMDKDFNTDNNRRRTCSGGSISCIKRSWASVAETPSVISECAGDSHARRGPETLLQSHNESRNLSHPPLLRSRKMTRARRAI